MRSARRDVPEAERQEKSRAITELLAELFTKQPAFESTIKVGLYSPIEGEVDTAPLFKLCQTAGKRIWLPVVDVAEPKGRLHAIWDRVRGPKQRPLVFRPFAPGITKMRNNRFGISEPVGRPGADTPGISLDLVIMPLVAFNETCDRIGMGSGYYDRTFPNSAADSQTTKLIGIAFELQKAEFEPQAHDTPLDHVITEERIYSRESGGAIPPDPSPGAG